MSREKALGIALGNINPITGEVIANFSPCKTKVFNSLLDNDETDYEYEIFSILSSARAWNSIILAGKRDSRRHSTTNFSKNVVVAKTSYQIRVRNCAFLVANAIKNLVLATRIS